MSYKDDFNSYLLTEKRFSEHTVVAYMKDIEQLFEILAISDDKELHEVNHKQLRGYLVQLVELGLENSCINRKLSSTKSFLKFLRKQDPINSKTAQKLTSLKQKKVLPQFVPEKQLWDEKIFQEVEDDFNRSLDELILELFYQTGIRLSELINLKENNITSSQIKVLGKRNKERIIPITNKLFQLIVKFQQFKIDLGLDSDLLMITKGGKKLYPKLVYDKVNYYLGKATNLSKKSPHVLRHTFATHMLNNGASLESIKKLLGHADLSATQIYTHNSFKQIKTIYEQAHPRGVSL